MAEIDTIIRKLRVLICHLIWSCYVRLVTWKCTLYMYIYLYYSISNFLDCNLATWTISGTWNVFCFLNCLCYLDLSANWIVSATWTASDNLTASANLTLRCTKMYMYHFDCIQLAKLSPVIRTVWSYLDFICYLDSVKLLGLCRCVQLLGLSHLNSV